MLKWINKKRNKKGFTLVELVVVIAILGILGGIAIPRLSGSRNTAKVSTHNANIRILKSAATMYLVDHPIDYGEENEVVITEGDYLETFKTYFDSGEIPKAYTDEPFKVTIEKDGNIKVAPGEVKIGGSGIELVGPEETGTGG